MDRATRRHHRERLKKNRTFHWGGDLRERKDGVHSKAVNTPTPCSCAGCGNPRKHFKQKTRQELRAEYLFERM